MSRRLQWVPPAEDETDSPPSENAIRLALHDISSFHDLTRAGAALNVVSYEQRPIDPHATSPFREVLRILQHARIARVFVGGVIHPELIIVSCSNRVLSIRRLSYEAFASLSPAKLGQEMRTFRAELEKMEAGVDIEPTVRAFFKILRTESLTRTQIAEQMRAILPAEPVPDPQVRAKILEDVAALSDRVGALEKSLHAGNPPPHLPPLAPPEEQSEELPPPTIPPWEIFADEDATKI